MDRPQFETPAAKAVDAYDRCLRRLTGWIERNLRADGSWGRPADCSAYFAPVCYAAYVGRHDWARAMLRHVGGAFVADDGELIQPPGRDQSLGYVPAWLAWAAGDAEMYDLCGRLLADLLTFQAPCGGFFGSRESRAAGRGPIDFDGTTMAAIALARCGRIGPATRAAAFLERLWHDQPDLARGVRTAWHEPNGWLDQPQTAVLCWPQPRQHYYKLGLLCLAFAHCFGVTGERRYLNLAEEVHARTIDLAADLWTNTLSHKMCWAATTLYAITGRADCLDHARRLADHLLTLQHDDGLFGYPELWGAGPPAAWELLPNIGCQFGLWIARTRAAVAHLMVEQGLTTGRGQLEDPGLNRRQGEVQIR